MTSSVIFLFMFFSALSTCHSTLDTRPFSLDQPIRPGKQLGRNRQADLLSRFQIDDELEFLRLLKGQSNARVLIKEANRVTRFSLVMAFLRLTFPPIAGLFLRS